MNAACPGPQNQLDSVCASPVWSTAVGTFSWCSRQAASPSTRFLNAIELQGLARISIFMCETGFEDDWLEEQQEQHPNRNEHKQEAEQHRFSHTVISKGWGKVVTLL